MASASAPSWGGGRRGVFAGKVEVPPSVDLRDCPVSVRVLVEHSAVDQVRGPPPPIPDD